MPWPTAVALSTGLATSITPVDAATSDVTTYILGWGPLGIFCLALAWLLLKGWRLIPPSFEETMRSAARADGRGDLERENERLINEKQAAERDRDEALRQLVPLLQSFVATTTTLIPLLQETVRHRDFDARGERY